MTNAERANEIAGVGPRSLTLAKCILAALDAAVAEAYEDAAKILEREAAQKSYRCVEDAAAAIRARAGRA